jgi:hypothetical protein
MIVHELLCYHSRRNTLLPILAWGSPGNNGPSLATQLGFPPLMIFEVFSKVRQNLGNDRRCVASLGKDEPI